LWFLRTYIRNGVLGESNQNAARPPPYMPFWTLHSHSNLHWALSSPGIG